VSVIKLNVRRKLLEVTRGQNPRENLKGGEPSGRPKRGESVQRCRQPLGASGAWSRWYGRGSESEPYALSTLLGVSRKGWRGEDDRAWGGARDARDWKD